MFSRTMSTLLAVTLVATHSPAEVLVVGGPQQTHPTVQAAVNAAVDGDVILVRTSSDWYVTIDGKSVSVIADAPTPVLFREMHVKNLSAGQVVTIAGFQHQPSSAGSFAFEFVSNQGSVRIQDCVALLGMNGSPAAHAFASADVAFSRCSLRGASGTFTFIAPTIPHPAVASVSSHLSFFDCLLTGGHGREGGYAAGGTTPLDGGAGAAAVWPATGSTVFFSGCTLEGGTGGIGWSGGVPPPQCTAPTSYPTSGGNGGDCLKFTDMVSLVRIRASLLNVGLPGRGGFDPCGNQAPNGSPGQPYSGSGANIINIAGSARTLLSPALVREGSFAALSCFGAPGDAVYLLRSFGTAQQWVPTIGSTLLLTNPMRRAMLGVVPASGRLDFLLPITVLPLGVDEAEQHLQLVMRDTMGGTHGGTAATLTTLDQLY